MAQDQNERLRAYDRALFSESISSLFWGVIRERRKHGKFTNQSIADAAGVDKAKLSRDFSGARNLTTHTIVNYASALGVDLEIRARDRETGAIFTSRGIEAAGYTLSTASHQPAEVLSPRSDAASNGREFEVAPISHGTIHARASFG